MFAPFFAGAAGPGQVWHWDTYVAKNNLWWHFQRFAEAVRKIDPAAEHFTPSILPHGRLRVYCLAGARHTLLWCRGTRNDWRSELERREEPEELAGMSVELPSLPKRAHVSAFDPWTAKWARLRLNGRKVDLPRFRRSIVVRVEE